MGLELIFLFQSYLIGQTPLGWEKYMENGLAFVVLGWFMLRMEKVMSKMTLAVDRNTKATLISVMEVSQLEKAREQAQELLDEMKAEGKGEP